MANTVVKILNLILVPFKYYNLFVVAASFLVIAGLFNLIKRLMHT